MEQTVHRKVSDLALSGSLTGGERVHVIIQREDGTYEDVSCTTSQIGDLAPVTLIPPTDYTPAYIAAAFGAAPGLLALLLELSHAH